jgi:hypothetical protein
MRKSEFDLRASKISLEEILHRILTFDPKRKLGNIFQTSKNHNKRDSQLCFVIYSGLTQIS